MDGLLSGGYDYNGVCDVRVIMADTSHGWYRSPVTVGCSRATPYDAGRSIVFCGVFAKLLILFARTPLVVWVALLVDRPKVLFQEGAAVTAEDIARPRNHQLTIGTRPTGIQFHAGSLPK